MEEFLQLLGKKSKRLISNVAQLFYTERQENRPMNAVGLHERKEPYSELHHCGYLSAQKTWMVMHQAVIVSHVGRAGGEERQQ